MSRRTARRTASYTAIKPDSMAADASAAISAKTIMLLRDVNKDEVDTDPFDSDEEFEDDETIVDDE